MIRAMRSTHLLEDNSMPVELLSNAGGVLDLGRDRKAQSRKLPDLTQQSDQFVTVMHPQSAIFVTQLHQTTTSLQTKVQETRDRGKEYNTGNKTTKGFLSKRDIHCTMNT